VAEKLNRNIKALGWVSFLTDVHSESILPLLPLFITQVLGLNKAFLGIIEGVANSTASLLKVASGWYSDKIRHRKNPTAAGYVLSTIAKPLLAFSTAGTHVLGIRLTDRVGKGIRTAPRDALIAESVPSRSYGRAFGFHRMMDTLGAVVGTLLAYIALNALTGDEEFRMRAVFLFSTIFGAAAVVVLLMIVREPDRGMVGVVPDSPETHGHAISGKLVIFIGINSLFCLGVFSYAFFLLRANDLGLKTGNVPLIYLYYNVIYASASLPMGKLSDAAGRKPVILLAYLSYGLTCLGFAFASHVSHAWALFALYGIHSATVNPASRALVAGLSKTSSHGTALGIYHTSVGLAAFPASLIAGVLWDRHGASAPFLIGGILAVVAFLLMLMLPLDSDEESSREE
jgi:MFS family permease